MEYLLPPLLLCQNGAPLATLQYVTNITSETCSTELSMPKQPKADISHIFTGDWFVELTKYLPMPLGILL